MNHHSNSNSNSGSALLAVYWAVAIISLAVFTTLQFLYFEVSHTNSRGNTFRAEQLAHSAAAIASHPAVSEYDPILSANTHDGSYFARITSEGGRLPINAFAKATHRKILENLFELWGMDSDYSRELVDQIIDWVDTDSRVTGSGRERAYYFSRGQPNLPFNRPFRDLNEITLLEGFEQLALVNPDWRSSFTLQSSGRLDINAADAELIAAVCGCSLVTAEQFVATRSGSDGIAGTEDDYLMESVEEALNLLLTHGPDREAILPLLTIDDSVKRIVAVGTVGDVSVEQTWVIKNRSTDPEVLNFQSRQLREQPDWQSEFNQGYTVGYSVPNRTVHCTIGHLSMLP